MSIRLHPEEPAAGPWRVERIANLVERFADRTRGIDERPLVIAIDGRSSSGKTTFAARFAGVVPSTAIVHTDDIAWWHSRFGWTDLAQHVLETVRAGQALAFRPQAWIERGREGAIVVPANMQVLLIEGVGSAREELADLLDARLWIQADCRVIERRNAARVAAGETTRADSAGWMAEELPFVAGRRPWEHADLIVAGAPLIANDPRGEIIVADGPLR